MALTMRWSKAPPLPNGCPMAACMSLLGGAWTTMVIWKLADDPLRFGELQKDIPGISPKVLTGRLRRLENKGVVIRHVVPSSPPSVEYSLSKLGRDIVPVIDTFVRVGTKLRECVGVPGPAHRRRA